MSADAGFKNGQARVETCVCVSENTTAVSGTLESKGRQRVGVFKHARLPLSIRVQ